MKHPSCFAASLLLVASFAVAQNADFKPRQLPIGAAAPDFNLPGTDGRYYSLADFKDAKILVVVFNCNHCPTAQAYEQRLIDLTAAYRDKGVAVVAISPNDDKAVRIDELGYTEYNDSLEEMKLRAADRGFNFPFLYDGQKQDVSRAYGALATPHVLIFDAQRKLRYNGRIDDSDDPAKIRSHDARNAIDALLAGRPAPVETTKVFGCSVKWSDKRDVVAKRLADWDKETAVLDGIDVAGVKALAANDSDKLRLINVWATWCGPCVEEFPDLVEIHRQYRKREFEVATISMDVQTKYDAATDFLNQQHASMTNYIFTGENRYDIIDNLDPQHWNGPIPYTLLVAPGGKVLYRCEGRFDSMELKKAIVGHLGRTYFD